MVFSSYLFLLLFLPLFLLAYALTPARARSLTILLGSLLFYAWAAPAALGLLVTVIVFTYLVGGRVVAGAGRARWTWLTLGVTGNLALLGYFKYANMAAGSLAPIFLVSPTIHEHLALLARLAHCLRTPAFREAVRNRAPLRMDVASYLRGALDKFEGLSTEEVRAIGIEIAMLGQTGLDIHNPTPQYTLRSLPGHYSGIHLCAIMYAAFKHFAPHEDVGIDFSGNSTFVAANFSSEATSSG